jgi:hypothetical protein
MTIHQIDPTLFAEMQGMLRKLPTDKICACIHLLISELDSRNEPLGDWVFDLAKMGLVRKEPL